MASPRAGPIPVGRGAVPAILFSKFRVAFSWNLGVGRKGQRTTEVGEKGRWKEGVSALISLQCSGKPLEGKDK